jgi:hypothetical protein
MMFRYLAAILLMILSASLVIAQDNDAPFLPTDLQPITVKISIRYSSLACWDVGWRGMLRGRQMEAR